MPPNPLEFDERDSLHLEFVLSVADLLAQVYGLAVPSSTLAVAHEALANTAIERFKPSQGVKIATTEEEAKTESKYDGLDIDAQCTATLRFESSLDRERKREKDLDDVALLKGRCPMRRSWGLCSVYLRWTSTRYEAAFF
jgi:hypothetical protein